MKPTLEELIRGMKVGWVLEHYSSGNNWIVQNSRNGQTMGAGATPEEALIEAIHSPMTRTKAAHYPRYGWSLLGSVFELKK